MAVADRRREWFSMGRVFTRAFGSFRALAVMSLTVVALFTILPESIFAFLLSEADEATVQMAASGINLVLGVINLVGQVALTHAALMHQQGRGVTMGSSLGVGLRLFLPMIGLSILQTLGIALGVLLLIVPGLYLATRWAVSMPARIVDGPGVTAAMGASSELTEGVRWQVFAYLLIIGVIVTGGAFAILYAIGMIPAAFALFGTAVVSPLFSAFSILVVSFGGAALYHELKWGAEQGPADAVSSIFD